MWDWTTAFSLTRPQSGLRRYEAACLNRIETEPRGFRNDFRGFGAGIEPKLIATFGSNLRKDADEHRWRQIDADHVRPLRHLQNGLVSWQPFDHRFLWIHRKHFEPQIAVKPHGLVAVFSPIIGSADNGDTFHATTIQQK